MPLLRVWIGDRMEREIRLDGGGVVIGRDPTCELPVSHPTLSRRHCKFTVEGAQCFVEDLGSMNGTLLNEVPVRERKAVGPGDVIRVGELKFVLVAEEALGEPGAGSAADVEQVMMEYSLRPQSAESLAPSAVDRVRAPKMFFTLYNVSKKLSTLGTADELLETSLGAILQVIPADRGLLALRDASTGLLAVRSGRARDRGLGNVSAQILSTTVLKRAVEERKAILAADAQSDPRFADQRSIVSQDIRSILCAPLWDEEQVYGAIYLDAVGRKAAFTEDDRALLTGIANLVAIRFGQERLRDRLAVEARLRQDLARYHSPDVVEALVKQGGRMAPGRRVVTVLFADIRDSTALAERLGEEAVHALLHRFYEMAAEAIFRHGGHLNKFVGDGVLAVFNAPIEVDRHALRAVQAAKDLSRAIDAFSRETPDRAFRVRIGINTGAVIAGDIGPQNRREYTVIGDAVNVAERLSKVETTAGLALSEETWSGLDGTIEGADRGEIVVKGRAKPVRVYELRV